jgi:hypothetical protein
VTSAKRAGGPDGAPETVYSWGEAAADEFSAAEVDAFIDSNIAALRSRVGGQGEEEED